MSKLLNDPLTLIPDYLRGFSVSHPEVRVDFDNRVVFRSVADHQTKVALISGGGSGHEPLHSGFVGVGMLDAACVGEVFSSPTPSQIGHAIDTLDSEAGVLLIVKNYTGDQLNFEIAAERAVAKGVRVRSLTIDDDVAGGGERTTGRRGLGLTVLVEKLLGAASEAGADLDQLYELGQRIRANGRSMGVALTSCVHPSAGFPTFQIAEGEIEIGIGIHGEPGLRRDTAGSASEIAALLVDTVLDALGPNDRPLSLIGLVNDMGGTPLIELHVMAGEVQRHLTARGHVVERLLVGPYITSLEMAGCSLTLLVADDELLDLWDAPVRTPSLNWGAAA